MTVAEAAVVGAALALASRLIVLVLYRRWFRQGFAGDSSIHWVLVRTLKRHPRARWIDEYVIAPEPFSYPTGFHRFASLFPLRIIERLTWLPNLVVWVVGVASFASYSTYAARSLSGVAPTETTLLALGFLLAVPSAYVFRGPAIAYLKLSERLLGRVLTSGAVLLVVVGSATGKPVPSLIAAAVLVGGAAVSSIFARQALGLGLPLLALLWLDWRPVAVLAGGAALALLVGRRRFIDGMRHSWIQWVVVYPKLTKRSEHMNAVLSRYVTLRDLRAAVGSFRDLGSVVLYREPVRAVVLYPELVAVATLMSLHRSLGWHWAAPLVAFGGLYAATATKRLNHLGESYRYLEFGLGLLVPFELAQLVQMHPQTVSIALLAAFGALSAVLFVVLVGLTWLPTLPEHDYLKDFLGGLALAEGDVVFPVTMSLGADICARTTGVRSFWWQPGVVAPGIYDEFIEEYPYLKRAFAPLAEKYGVTHVVCDRAALAAVDWTYDFSQLTPVAEDGRYVAYAYGS